MIVIMVMVSRVMMDGDGNGDSWHSTVFELFGSLKGEVMTFLPPEVPFV
jgi:hypothetical protein